MAPFLQPRHNPVRRLCAPWTNLPLRRAFKTPYLTEARRGLKNLQNISLCLIEFLDSVICRYARKFEDAFSSNNNGAGTPNNEFTLSACSLVHRWINRQLFLQNMYREKCIFTVLKAQVHKKIRRKRTRIFLYKQGNFLRLSKLIITIIRHMFTLHKNTNYNRIQLTSF